MNRPYPADSRFQEVGRLTRVEASTLVVGYTFDLRTNELTAERAANPSAGTEHRFIAYRLKDQASKAVSMLNRTPVLNDEIEAEDE